MNSLTDMTYKKLIKTLPKEVVTSLTEYALGNQKMVSGNSKKMLGQDITKVELYQRSWMTRCTPYDIDVANVSSHNFYCHGNQMNVPLVGHS